ncbi:MAG: pitrilysin family protein [Bacteroidales bacterium]
MLNRTLPPQTKQIENIPVSEPERRLLDNRIPLFLIGGATQDVCRIDIVSPAGSRFEEKKLLASFTSRLIREGTRTMSAAELAEKIDFFGAHLDVSSGKDTAIISLYTLNKYLPETLPLLRSVLAEPAFDNSELEILRQNRIQQFLINNQKVRYLARRHFNALIFGDDHPYGKVFDREDFDRISRDDIVDFHRKRYLTPNSYIVVSGKVSEETYRVINDHLGGISVSNESIDPLAPFGLPVPEPSVRRIIRPGAVQSAFRMGRQTWNKLHPDYRPMKVVNTLLGGYFGSRLMTNIREDKGYTYGIGSALVSLQSGGFFFITSEVGAGYTSDAISEVKKELENLCGHPVPDEELDLVRNYMLGSLLRSVDGPFAQAELFRSLYDYQLDYSWLHDYLEVIRSVTADEIMSLSQRYLHPDSLSLLIAGEAGNGHE